MNPAMLTKAVLRAADLLDLAQDLPVILGIEAHQWERLRSGAQTLQPDSAAWPIAVRIASLFRSLVTLLGDANRSREWLDSPHATLGSSPRELLRTDTGRERVFGYLDAVQKYEIKLPPRSRH